MGDSKKVAGIFARYLFVLLIALGNFYLFYKILTPVTVFIVEKILSLFNPVYVLENVLVFNDFAVELIPACVAGSAFFLMFLLVFTTGEIRPLKRFYMLFAAVILLLALNVSRIVFLILIANNSYFEIIHWVLWHLVSIFFVVAIWFFVAGLFRVKSIPIYSDLKYLISLTRQKRETSKKRKNPKRSKKHK